jgi:lipopolysaccharide heptosyltransferase I
MGREPRNDTLRSREFERILLIKPSALGDVIHTIPVLVQLRARYPTARIDWLITPENAEMVRHHPGLTQVITFPRGELARIGRSWSATIGICRLLAALRRNRYDLVIDMHGQLRSALFTLATGAPVRIGFDRPRHRAHDTETKESSTGPWQHGWSGAREGAWLAYSHRIPVPTLDVHAVDRYLWLGGLLGFDDRPPDFRIYLSPEDEAQADRLLPEQGPGARPLAVLVPGTIWPTKHWRPEGFAEVGRHYREKGFDVAIAGTARERELCRAIAATCPGSHDLSGRTTPAGLAALIRRSTICVTNDSGSMHLAVALDRPVVSIFGPTDPVRIGPYGRPSAVVRANLTCSPCHLRWLWNCPHDHRCMHEVTSRMVVERAEQILGQIPSRA